MINSLGNNGFNPALQQSWGNMMRVQQQPQQDPLQQLMQMLGGAGQTGGGALNSGALKQVIQALDHAIVQMLLSGGLLGQGAGLGGNPMSQLGQGAGLGGNPLSQLGGARQPPANQNPGFDQLMRMLAQMFPPQLGNTFPNAVNPQIAQCGCAKPPPPTCGATGQQPQQAKPPAPPAQIKGTEKGGWLTSHDGGYKANPDGSFDINKGQFQGCKAVPVGGKDNNKGAYNIMGPNGEQKGVFNAPGGANKIASPLTFDLNGAGKVETVDAEHGKVYDINGNGQAVKTGWAGHGEGVLAFDSDGSGVAGKNGRELLGNNTDIDGTGKQGNFANGFEALKALADKHLGPEATAKGYLDENDLKALEQKCGLTMLVDDQHKSLSELGVTRINLGYQEAGKNADENGNEHRQLGAFVQNGQVKEVDDAWFRYQ